MRSKRRAFLSIALQLAAGACIGLCAILALAHWVPGVFALSPFPFLLALAGTICALLAALYAHVLVHEAGHLLGGRATGYRFVSYRAGQNIWMRRGGRIVRGRYRLAGTGGQCLMAPPGSGPDAPFPWLWYNLGGPLANLVLGGLTAAGALLSAPPLARFLCVLFGVPGLLLGALNLLPPLGGDGSNLVALHRSKEAQRALWVTLAAAERLTQGERLRALPAEWFSFAAPAPDASALVCGVHAMRAERLMDSGSYAQAAALAQKLLALPQLLPAQQNELRCQLLLLVLLLKGPCAEAQALDTKEVRSYIRLTAGYPLRQCLLYALARLAQPDSAAAAAALSAMEQAGAAYPYPGELAQCRELAAAVDSRAAAPLDT